MANVTQPKTQTQSRDQQQRYPTLSRNFELFYSFAILWLLGGAYADGWSHTHVPELEEVFTPAHIFLYTGAAICVGFTIYHSVKNIAMGYPLGKLLPFGYHNAFWGVIIFSVAGPSDLLWHSMFGIEQNIEATFSPTHFAAMIGIFLIFSAPLASWIKRTEPFSSNSLGEALPAIISGLSMFSLMSLITTWANPFANRFPVIESQSMSTDINQGFGMISIMFHTILLMALILFTLREQILPIGSYTIILGVNGLLTQLVNYNFSLILVSVLTGLFIDFIYKFLQPSKKNKTSFRIFSFISPIVYWALYFISLELTSNVWWKVHTWSGAVFIPGIFGLLVSYLIVPIEYEEPDN